MKKSFCLFLLLLSFCTLFGQSNRYIDSTGHFLWQYHHSVMRDYTDSSRAVITFVFINGEEQTAISYRHEIFKSEIEWLETESGICTKDGKVVQITANLAPHEAVVWKLKSTNACQNKKSKALTVEQGAILIMNKDFQIRKERLPEQSTN